MQFEMTHHSLLLAQEGPPAPTDTNAITGQPADAGTGPGGVGGNPSAAPSGNLLLVLLGVFLIFIIFSMMGQRRDRKKRDSMLNAIKKHDRVQTVGGVLGSVIEVKPDTVVLKVDESSNTRITFSRNSIQQVFGTGKNDESDKES